MKRRLLFLPVVLLAALGCQVLTPPATPRVATLPPSQAPTPVPTHSEELATALPTHPPVQNPTAPAAVVPLPTGEDIVRVFFALIGEGRIAEAVGMMDANAAPDDTARQTWGVNFNTLAEIKVVSIQPWEQGNWSVGQQTYQVVLEVRIKTGHETEYNWENGQNMRWVTLAKDPANQRWKIDAIATGQ